MTALVSLSIGDEPRSWRDAGFTVDEQGSIPLDGISLRLEGTGQGRGIRSWTLSADPRDASSGSPGTRLDQLDGIETLWSPTPPAPAAPPDHANGVVGLDHVVLATPDQERSTRALIDAGFELRRIRDLERNGEPFQQRFFLAGPTILEVVGPPDTDGPGPMAFFGLAFTVADLETTTTLLGEHLGSVRDAVQPGRQIATLRHRALDSSVAVAFMSPRPRH